MIAKLWSQYQQNIQDVIALRNQAKILKAQIEEEVAKAYYVSDTSMTRWDGCLESPTGFCFTNPGKNPWICLYCGADLMRR